MQEKTVRYSEAFKLQVIKELERGDFRSITEARQRYGISGGSTIHKWLKKYHRADILPKRVRIEMPNEQDQIKKLKKQVRNLEKALAETRVNEIINQAHFEVLGENW